MIKNQSNTQDYLLLTLLYFEISCYKDFDVEIFAISLLNYHTR